MKEVIEAIGIDESKRLIELEAVVSKGVRTFIEVGDALAEIRDSRLYRSEFATFQEYCETKWQFSRMRASQLISSAKIMKQIPDECKPGFTEKSARPLVHLSKNKCISVVKSVVKTAQKTGRKITAKTVREAAESVKTRPRGGLANEALDDLDKARQPVDVSARAVILKFLDDWWEENKSGFAYSTLTERQVVQSMKAHAEKTL